MCWGWNLAEQMTNENEIFLKIDFREKRCGKIDQSVWRAEKIDRLEWRNDKSGQSECTGLEIIFLSEGNTNFLNYALTMNFTPN